ncbi:hypothetical protein [Rhodococcus sp. JS3073]|uniref:hypothetical protein n=1 Tax=Rhodococcus sp. JS3073 TaxID=3002901 RepID=UPI00228580C0|nr:hypothetical protein [Rhodococcus sp. JS3073]WAM19013.1 hypothetical protein OYT95_41300 [Rhodococcus sp. JS3073]
MPEHLQRGDLSTTTGRDRPVLHPGPLRREQDQAAIEADVRNYRQLHRQKRQTATTRRPRVVRDETEVFLVFADIWAPFGGPPEAELFVTYGITRATFFERLWQIITSMKCDRSVAQRLSAAYPPPPSL